ncbi:MAG: cadmium resistance transporter [Limnothrix sp. BL-A-16]|jgi:cadmium resistance protein CadD (predicted permease)
MIDQRPLAELAISAFVAGTSSFIATNIDDVVVLMVLFGRPDRLFRDRQILIGRYLGFGLIVLASLVGFWGGLLLPPWAIGLLGFLPIGIGISQLRASQSQESESPDSQLEAFGSGDQALNGRSTNLAFRHRVKKLRQWLPWLSPQVIQVTMITLACGADNIGIYIPLFASCNWLELSIILWVFFAGVGLLCWLTRRFSRYHMITQWTSRFGHQFVPWIFIALGIGIFWESNLPQLLFSFMLP